MYSCMAHTVEQEQEQEQEHEHEHEHEQTPIIRKSSFYFKEGRIIFVRNPHNLQKKLEQDEEPDKIRFDTCMLRPSFPFKEKSSHLCYARLPVKMTVMGVRAQLNYPNRNEFNIYLDYCYVKTTKGLDEMEPQITRTFYLFENQITYTESDIPWNDNSLPELQDYEYEIISMEKIGTVVLPQTFLTTHQPFYERIYHVLMRDYSKVLDMRTIG